MLSLDFDAIAVDCHNDLMRAVMRQGQLGEAGTFKHRWLPELRAATLASGPTSSST